MTKKNKIIIALCMGIAIFSSGIVWAANANLNDNKIQTVYSELGIGETFYEPPEQMSISLETDDMTFQYEYTIESEVGNSSNILTDNIPTIEYYVFTNGNSTLRIDEQGRIIGLMTDLMRESGWIANSLSQTDLMDVLEEVAEQIDIDLSEYSDMKQYGECQLRLYKDIDNPHTDFIHAEFDETGKFCFIQVFYNDVVDVSAEDEAYFTALLEESIDSDTPYTVSTSYVIRKGVLIASYTVTFTKDSGETWVENYVAGKPIE